MSVPHLETQPPAAKRIDQRLRIAERTSIAEAAIALSLRDPAGRDLPGWEPGAHIDLVLGEGPDGDPLLRQYSLCGDPDDHRAWRIAVLCEEHGRGGSRLVHDELYEGSVVRVRGPRNAFALRPAGRYLFIAGGIGVTPILPMIRHAAAESAEWQAVYAARTRPRLCFADELAAYDRVRFHVDAEQGPLDLPSLLAGCDAKTAVYACGPAAMLDALVAAHSGAPWTLQIERFAPAVSAPRQERAFEVQIASTGQTFAVSEGETVLEVLRREGLPVEWSCREGICGTCETGVLEGAPDHRDGVLTDEERALGDTMMICCSRALGERIVLDL